MVTKEKTSYPEAQSPIILRCHRLMEAFAKSDEERDFYLDTVEGFLILVNLDKTEDELVALEKEILDNQVRYHLIPKLTFYEQKKIMEGFVHEKVYDIDTKEKLMDIIQSKEARENFLEFIYDHLIELEKWQQYYQERSRIRIIEWLRQHNISFVFEEDLELTTQVIEKLKENLFEKKVSKEVETGRKALTAKAKSYYSNEALNPRPKRGRPPKQAIKQEFEPQISKDIYTTPPAAARPFLFTPDISSASEVTFSARFEEGRALIAHSLAQEDEEDGAANIDQKLSQLRSLSSHWVQEEDQKDSKKGAKESAKKSPSKEKKAPKKRIVPRDNGPRDVGPKEIGAREVVSREVGPKETSAKQESSLAKEGKKPIKEAKKKPSSKEAPVKKRKVHLRRKKVK
jgi:hypothetical protein